jgi:hypothetical protein
VIERCAMYDLGPRLDPHPGCQLRIGTQAKAGFGLYIYVCIPADRQLTGCSLTMVSTS